MTSKPEEAPTSTTDQRVTALRNARKRDSDVKRSLVRNTVATMLVNGDNVTFTAVACQARVSTWLVYASGVREHIEAAIRQQSAEPSTDRDGQPSNSSLRTDLALGREEIRASGRNTRSYGATPNACWANSSSKSISVNSRNASMRW